MILYTQANINAHIEAYMYIDKMGKVRNKIQHNEDKKTIEKFRLTCFAINSSDESILINTSI